MARPEHKVIAGVVVAAVLAGCVSDGLDPYFTKVHSKANVFVAPQRTTVAKIAVLPFKAPTELIGSATSDMLVTEFLRMGRYTLVERGQMASVLGETELAMAGLSEARAVQVAKMFGAEAVVLGTVDEYATQANRGRTFAVVGLSARMIDCQSGQILWSADLAKRAEDSRTPLSGHARSVVHELVAGLYVRLSRTHPGKASPGAQYSPTTPTLPPSTPSNVAVTDMGLRESVITWTPTSGANCDVKVERSSAATGPFARVGLISVRRGRFTDSGTLKDAATYYYRLTAVGASGEESPPSPVVETMTAPPPDAPSGVCASVPGSRAVRLVWTPPRSEGITRYRVERAVASQSDQWTARRDVATTEFAEGGRRGTDVLDSTEYLYRVAAINRVGAIGSPSAPVRVTTLPPPAAVARLVAQSGGVRCIPVTWQPNPEMDVEGYEVERAPAGSDAFARITTLNDRKTTRFLDGRRDPGSLADAQSFQYRVRAFNGVGAYGAWSAPATATTRDVPPVVMGVAAQGALPRWVNVTWTASLDEKAIGYEIERAEGKTGPFARAGTVEGRATVAFADRNGAPRSTPTGRLKDGTLYRFRVRAINTAKAVSQWSVAALAVTKPAPLPPYEVAASSDQPAAIVLKWTPNTEPDIAAYIVESRSRSGTSWSTVARVSDAVARHEDLDHGEQRVYRVKAIDADTLESGWSAEAGGAARSLPPPPTQLAANWTREGLILSWMPPREGIRQYRVWKHGLLSKERICETAGPTAALPAASVGRRATLSVTALDEELLESPASERFDVQAPETTTP